MATQETADFMNENDLGEILRKNGWETDIDTSSYYLANGTYKESILLISRNDEYGALLQATTEEANKEFRIFADPSSDADSISGSLVAYLITDNDAGPEEVKKFADSPICADLRAYAEERNSEFRVSEVSSDLLHFFYNKYGALYDKYMAEAFEDEIEAE